MYFRNGVTHYGIVFINSMTTMGNRDHGPERMVHMASKVNGQVIPALQPGLDEAMRNRNPESGGVVVMLGRQGCRLFWR